MPGRVVGVLVEEGATVEAGQGLVVLEAMKMQNEIQAERAGTVTARVRRARPGRRGRRPAVRDRVAARFCGRLRPRFESALSPFFELAATLGAILWCALAPPRRPGRRARPPRRVTPSRAALVCGLTGFAGCALMTLWIGWPQPQVHDEFGYLLHADTFARGRLTNPPHPFWPHFENFHIVQLPTYTAKYHPAQGLILAAGQRLAGHPAVGIWLGCGAMGAALAWMLAGWVPARWAMLAGLVATLRLAVGSYWGHSYWGGAVAVAGGALVFGALGRLRRGPHVGPSLVLGLGFVVLALSRPFEGALVSLPVAAAIVGLAIRDRPALGPWLRRVAAPIAVLMLALAAWAGYYNWRTTGDPTEHPYLLHERLYDPAPLFVWLPEKPLPTYRHPIMENYWRVSLDHYRSQRSFNGYLHKLQTRSRELWGFFLGGLLSLPLLALPWALRGPWMHFFGATLLVGVAGLLTITFVVPHYAAPLVAPALVLGVRCLRQARLYAPGGRPVGPRFAAVLLPATCALLVIQGVGLRSAHRSSWSLLRTAVAQRLDLEPGDDLVLVRFAPGALDPGWTYNGGDLERAPIVWARQMSPAENCALAAHYAGREVWDLEVMDGFSPPRLGRYRRCGRRAEPRG